MGRRLVPLILICILLMQNIALVEETRISSVMINSKVIIPKDFRYNVVLAPRIKTETWLTRLVVNQSNIYYPTGIGDPTINLAGRLSDTVAIIIIPNVKIERQPSILSDELVGIMYDRFIRFASSKDYKTIIPLIGKHATLENLAYAVYYMEKHGIRYAILGISHGYMNKTKGLHGVLMYANEEPALVNGEILRQIILEKYGFNQYKARFVTDFIWISCYIQDQYETYGDNSLPGYFDKKYDTKNIPPEYQLNLRSPVPSYDNEHYFFKLYGKGVTTIPQEAIDFFDQTIEFYSKQTRYRAAIVWGSRVVQGYLNIRVEFIPTDFDVTTWTVLDNGEPEGFVLDVKSVKAYVVNITAWAETGGSEKDVSSISDVQQIKKVVRSTSSGDYEKLTALERILFNHPTYSEFELEEAREDKPHFVEPFDAVYAYFNSNATIVAEE